MKKFRFRLESVLKLRKSREDAALRALGFAQSAYQAELQTKAKMQADLSASYERRARTTDQIFGMTAYGLEEQFIKGQNYRLLRQEHAIGRAARGVEKALRSYLQAKRQTRMIEVLREKDHAEWKKQVAKREQKEMDELTVMRYRMRKDVA
jgi:flagellar FliJ protein